MILFLGCHCDDLELGCGGTINKLSSHQDLMCVTFSNHGIVDGKMINVEQSSRKGLSSLGVRQMQYADFQSNFFYQDRQRIWEYVHDLDLRLKPNLVFVNEPDNQQDHKVLYEEVLRNFRGSSVVSYKASVRNSPEDRPNYYEVLSKENVKAKQFALTACYPEEYQRYVYFRPENIEAVLRVGGLYVEAEFAETFRIVKWIR